MLHKLSARPDLEPLLPFVRLWYARRSHFLWTDDSNTTHDVFQGEGGEQGDPLMPALFALAQHDALEAAAGQLREGERLLAFLDDLYVVTSRDRDRAAFETVAEEVEAL